MVKLSDYGMVDCVLRVVTSVPEISAAVLETFGEGGFPLGTGIDLNEEDYIAFSNIPTMTGKVDGVEGTYLKARIGIAFSVGLQYIAETQPVVNAELIRVEKETDEFGNALTWEPFMLEVQRIDIDGNPITVMQELGGF